MFAAIGLAVLLGIVLGAINGLLVAVIGLQPFISTLVMMLAGRGIARVITGGQNTNAENALPGPRQRSVPRAAAELRARDRDRHRRRARDAPHRPRAHDRVDRHQPAGQPLAGIRPRPILIAVYVLSAALALSADCSRCRRS
jgi:simple sugar transport system permease protein